MTEWSEHTEDHLTELRWNGGLFVDNDGYPLEPPSDGLGSDGLDGHIQRHTQGPRSYPCRYCGKPVCFLNRLPYNFDGSAHRCLAEARKKEPQP